jgi:flavin reductase (DIM6/NTAB) family NADH-FMN oxidoreductase RutF
MILDLATLSPAEKQNWLQHVVAPRPIALASTIDADGHVNLSPFSFFNLFSSNPPIVIFSPARRVRDNSIKHTLENVQAVPEVVIHLVTREMVQQQSLASCEFPSDVNEFTKAGFTEEKATRVRPPMVKEAPVKLECRVVEIKPLGDQGGAGNLVICEVLCIHIDEKLLDENGKPDQRKILPVARLGGHWYTEVNEQSLFEVEKPNIKLGMGFDALPASIRNSLILTGNQLAQLANLASIPDIDPTYDDAHVRQIIQYYSINPEEMERELHQHAARLLDGNKVDEAWQVLLAGA